MSEGRQADVEIYNDASKLLTWTEGNTLFKDKIVLTCHFDLKNVS